MAFRLKLHCQCYADVNRLSTSAPQTKVWCEHCNCSIIKLKPKRTIALNFSVLESISMLFTWLLGRHLKIILFGLKLLSTMIANIKTSFLFWACVHRCPRVRGIQRSLVRMSVVQWWHKLLADSFDAPGTGQRVDDLVEESWWVTLDNLMCQPIMQRWMLKDILRNGRQIHNGIFLCFMSI